VTAIATELESLLRKLPEEKAVRLTGKIREVMSAADDEGALSLEELKKRRPELAEFIGAWADIEFEEPAELPLPPAKVW